MAKKNNSLKVSRRVWVCGGGPMIHVGGKWYQLFRVGDGHEYDDMTSTYAPKPREGDYRVSWLYFSLRFSSRIAPYIKAKFRWPK